MVNTTPIEPIKAEEQIMEAARRVFIQKGFAGARMQEIADEAGINKALLHYYFRNKEKLFAIIFKEAFMKLLPGILEVFRSDEPIREKIKKFTASYIGMLINHPYIPVFVLSEIHRDPEHFFKEFINGELKSGLAQIRASFVQAIEKGEILPVDPRQLMINMMSLCVFPFIARPMFQHLLAMSDTEFRDMQADRTETVSAFIIAAITPKKSL